MRNNVLSTKAAILALIIALAVTPVSATIINIPDDYETIQEGIDASSDSDTVLVQPGTYIENINFSGHNIVLGSLFLTTGDTSYISQTVIDGDSAGTVVSFLNGENDGAIITGFTIQNGYSSIYGGGISCVNSNPKILYNIVSRNTALGTQLTDATGGGICCLNSNATISNNLISENDAFSYIWSSAAGGGIYCHNSNPVISYNTICDNDASAEWGHGGGISLFSSSPLILKNILIRNSALHWGGGIYCFESNPAIQNNTISRNQAFSGGGIYCALVSNPIVTNTILKSDSSQHDSEIDFDDSSSPTFCYCNIEGGWPGEGNIDANPLFVDPDNGDFHLMSTACGDAYDSPCIDAGSPTIIDSLLDCSWGLGTLLSDMGAYGGGDSVQVGIDDQEPELPKQFALFQNYPNPFNVSTIIKYELPHQSQVMIDIYDILGRKVQTLYDGGQLPGSYSLIWNADDFSSGMYFYKLTAGEFKHTKKMVLLK